LLKVPLKKADKELSKMIITKPEDIEEIKILRGKNAETDANDYLSEGWELLDVLSVAEKIHIIIGLRADVQDIINDNGDKLSINEDTTD